LHLCHRNSFLFHGMTEAIKVIQSLEHLPRRERLRDLGMLSIRKNMFKGDVNVLKYLRRDRRD